VVPLGETANAQKPAIRAEIVSPQNDPIGPPPDDDPGRFTLAKVMSDAYARSSAVHLDPVLLRVHPHTANLDTGGPGDREFESNVAQPQSQADRLDVHKSLRDLA
jgi:hypothetical protein